MRILSQVIKKFCKTKTYPDSNAEEPKNLFVNKFNLTALPLAAPTGTSSTRALKIIKVKNSNELIIEGFFYERFFILLLLIYIYIYIY